MELINLAKKIDLKPINVYLREFKYPKRQADLKKILINKYGYMSKNKFFSIVKDCNLNKFISRSYFDINGNFKSTNGYHPCYSFDSYEQELVGGSIDTLPVVQRSKALINKFNPLNLHPLSDNEILRECKCETLFIDREKNKQTIIRDSKSNQPLKFNTGKSYIINLGDNKGDKQIGGTHWVALYCNGKLAYYFDSYGMEPPNELRDIIKENDLDIIYTTDIIQHQNSVAGGYYCIAFINFMEEFIGDKDRGYKYFLRSFINVPTWENDLNLYRYLAR